MLHFVGARSNFLKVAAGTNQLVASSQLAIVQAARNVLYYQPGHDTLDRPELWDGWTLRQAQDRRQNGL